MNPISAKFGVRLSQTSPAYLHANSTSHVWIFSAIAELIDNAYDPDVKASQLVIDKKNIRNHDALVFTDNGAGMDAEKLYKMLSFGYCDKIEIKGHKPVGHYGNGFKSGSMRIGKDAMVFTKHRMTMSVGFLSQTYLKDIRAETVLVPIVTWDLHSGKLVNHPDCKGSLEAITKHSLFKSEDALLKEFQALSESRTGTQIIIYNLKRDDQGTLELDFESDPSDMFYSEHSLLDSSTMIRPVKAESSEHMQSLREYASILFLKPKMKIWLRGQKVKTKYISKTLSYTEKDFYKPHWLPKAMKITFGFTPPGSEFGIMVYNKNRLIKAHEKVGYQKQPNELGVGVVGICDADFLEPTHDKQNFNKDDKYFACMSALSRKLNEYWDAKKGQPASQVQPQEKPDWTWAQCDNCLKWRRMPDGISEKDLPDSWACRMNLDLTHNRCDVPEEPEDEDEVLNRATYQKVAPKPKGPKKISAEAQMKMMQLERTLMESEQKTRQQQQLIQSLNHEKLVIEKQLHERSAQQLLGAVSRKGSQMPVAMFKNDRPVGQVSTNNGDIVITQNSSGSESEDVKPSTSAASKRKLGRQPVSDEVIMIDSDSDDDGEPPAKKNYTKSSSRDVKPDVNKLNKQMTKDKDKSAAKDKKPNKETLDAVKKSESGSDCNECKDKGAQVKKMENTLSNLRKHVWELMQVIVPDLELENLEMVDQVVVEMVRVNKQSPENGESAPAGSSSESGEEPTGLAKVKKQDEDSTQDPSAAENGDMCNGACNGDVEPSTSAQVNGNVKREESDSQSRSILTNGKNTSMKDRS